MSFTEQFRLRAVPTVRVLICLVGVGILAAPVVAQEGTVAKRIPIEFPMPGLIPVASVETTGDDAAADGRQAAQERVQLDCTGPAWERRGTPCAEMPPDPYDLRRTVGKLPANFARGMIGVFSMDNLPTLLGGAALTAATRTVDGSPKPPDYEAGAMGELGHSFGNPIGVGGMALGLFVAGRIADVQPVRDWTYDLFLATTVNFVYTETLKRTVGRTRPDGSNQKSFPSGHTSNAFAWATVMDRHYGPAVGLPMYALATLIGASRVDRGSHYYSDVVAGAVIGIIVGRSVTRQNSESMDDGPRFTVIPIAGQDGGNGVGFTVVF